MNSQHTAIVGAGPAGLAAALTIAQAGGKVSVFERRTRVGKRFHGDFQGLENWSSENDVLDELSDVGIQPSFEYKSFRECVLFDAKGKEYVCRSEKPLWYLVRRGTGPGTLDEALKTQAQEAGVNIEMTNSIGHLPDGGIVATGPRRVDALAVGFLFDTDLADGAYGVLSNDLAAGGYSYLLISSGKATLASCLFTDFHNEKRYLEKTVDFFQTKVGLIMRNERHFGGFGNMSATPLLRVGNLLFAGEAAGFQDSLFGFGMRYAMLSGHMAGRAFQSGDLASYKLNCEKHLIPMVEAAIVNRYLFSRLGIYGQQKFLELLCGSIDSGVWLRKRYARQKWMSIIYPFLRKTSFNKNNMTHECKDDCDCTYCKCTRQIEADKVTNPFHG